MYKWRIIDNFGFWELKYWIKYFEKNKKKRRGEGWVVVIFFWSVNLLVINNVKCYEFLF